MLRLEKQIKNYHVEVGIYGSLHKQHLESKHQDKENEINMKGWTVGY